jgi:hypothetical protein
MKLCGKAREIILGSHERAQLRLYRRHQQSRADSLPAHIRDPEGAFTRRQHHHIISIAADIETSLARAPRGKGLWKFYLSPRREQALLYPARQLKLGGEQLRAKSFLRQLLALNRDCRERSERFKIRKLNRGKLAAASIDGLE